MRIGILSMAPRCYSTRRLKEAAEQRGHRVRVLNTSKFSIGLEHGEPDLYYRDKRIGAYDAIIPRIGASMTYYGTAVVRQFEQMEVFTPNTAGAILSSRDKLRSLQILSRHDIGIPETVFVRQKTDVLPAIARVGGAPVVIKVLEGTQGVGVILADTEKVAQAIIETLQSAKQNVLIQKFVAESRGRDVRAFVVGDRVVASIRRVAQGQEFRSNVHQGGRAEAIKLDPEYAETAVRAAQILGLKVAGVDMLEGTHGPQIMEVNSSPGLEGIEGATKLDIAGEIIDCVAEQVSFPQLDIRQRLTVSAGYDVSEVHVGQSSELAGKTIAESGLRDRDIAVLTLQHGKKVTPNPKSSRTLEPGDTLLCFGPLENMKSLIAGPNRRRRKPKKLKTQVQSEAAELAELARLREHVEQAGGIDRVLPPEEPKPNDA